MTVSIHVSTKTGVAAVKNYQGSVLMDHRQSNWALWLFGDCDDGCPCTDLDLSNTDIGSCVGRRINHVHPMVVLCT